MELVWNNPSPNRTVYRPSAWEVIRKNGTRKVVRADEIQTIADQKADHGAKQVSNDLQPLFSPYFCL